MTQFYQFNQRLRFASKGLVALSLGLLCSFAVGETTSNKISPLSWYPRADLNEEEAAALPSFCRGAYRTPEIDVITGDNINTESNLTRMHRNGDAEFEGNAVIQQTDRVLYSDYAKWLYESGKAEFKGGVQLSSPNVVISSEGAALDNNTSIAEFYQAQYAVPANHFRGTARYIEAKQSGQLQLKTATFTYCEPEQKDWSIAASTLNLDNETGVGSAWNTRLQIADIPIMYFPYYRFPISDKRMTGFLNPSFSLNAKRRSSGELVPSNVYVTEAEIPFYINIAPQYDATLTPHYIFEHGYMLDSQFRHKTHLLGDGELNYSYLEKDQTTEEKRYMFNATQKGQWGKYFSHNWVYNQVSDYEYLNDINAVGESDLTTHLPRRGVINFNNSAWHSDITVESFQTVDKTIALQNRPYHRMPQLNFSYKPVVYNQLQINQTFQATRFERYASEWMMNNTTQNLELKELSGFATLNGDRFLSDTSISYPFEVPFGFLTPKVEYRFRSYDLRDGDDFLTDGTLSSRYGIDELDLKPSIASARYSLDGGLYFDR
ncbi:MAG: LPS assembly protein LptD, partial [Venatoribacter sp.]